MAKHDLPEKMALESQELEAILRVIEEIANGDYSDRILEFTTPENSLPLRELAEAVSMMMVKIEARELNLEQLNKKLKKSFLDTVMSIAKALARRDSYTKDHDVRVGEYAERLARRLGLGGEECDNIKTAGILHDIGKIGFSDKIFNNVDVKPTDDMVAEIKKHPLWAVEILKGLDFLGPTLDYIKYHHERPDGSGYPEGLKDEDIPLGAKIISVADCFDAITTDRPYQKGKTADEALAILGKLAGKGLDSKLVRIFALDIEENGMIK